jgi:lysophospholipase L1-like esterase
VGRSEFFRAVDVLIDLTRTQAKPPAFVLISPPPVLSDLERSGQFTEALELLASQHRLSFVNLHKLFTDRKEWKVLYQDAGDDVFLLYPNAAGQRDIADAILNAIE